MYYDTVRHWKNKLESIKNTLKSGRPKFASCKETVTKIKGIIEEMQDLPFVILHEKKAHHYQLFTLFGKSV